MNAPQLAQSTAELCNAVLDAYIADLSDAELLTRPGPGCNHLAYQLGHLIVSHVGLLNDLVPGSAPELPSGFKEKHADANAGSNDPGAFCSKQEYVDLLAKCREATKAELAKATDAEFDEQSPESLRGWFPTRGHIWALIATHPLMHAGQFVPVRRMLGKPVVM